jgi:hypothetical protein
LSTLGLIGALQEQTKSKGKMWSLVKSLTVMKTVQGASLLHRQQD